MIVLPPVVADADHLAQRSFIGRQEVTPEGDGRAEHREVTGADAQREDPARRVALGDADLVGREGIDVLEHVLVSAQVGEVWIGEVPVFARACRVL